MVGGSAAVFAGVEGPNFEVWLDTNPGNIPGGASGSKQIEQALDGCGILPAVPGRSGPKARAEP